MSSPADQLDRSMVSFMRYFLAHINPILHRTRYRGRPFPDSEIMVVMALSVVGPLSPIQISRGLGMQKGSLTSVLRRLERLGFISRRDNPADERSYIAELTGDGAAFADHLGRQRQQGFRALFATMAPADIAAAAEGLDLLTAHLKKMEETTMTLVKDTESKNLNWYQAASPEARREYDMFGPWINEVKTEADMPPRFRALYPDHKDARFLLKVPINADRRQVRPGMDLYQAIIAIHDDRLALMRLMDGRIEAGDHGWNEVAAIGSYGDKLQGIWTLYLKDGKREAFEYNKVSTELMDAVTDFIRPRLREPDDPGLPAPPDPQFEITDDDLFFGSALMEIRRRSGEPAVPIHFEPQDRPCRDENGNRALATGLLLIETPGELVIVDRAKPAREPSEPCHASNDIFVPFARITGFSLADASGSAPEGFHVLSLQLDRQRIEVPWLQVPELTAARLEARGIGRL